MSGKKVRRKEAQKAGYEWKNKVRRRKPRRQDISGRRK